MKRIISLALASSFLFSCSEAVNQAPQVSVENNLVVIASPYVIDTIHVMFLSDTHLYIYDERNEPYNQYSKRMSEAYNYMTSYRDGSVTTPMESLKQTVKLASEKKVDAIFHIGDLVSFPSELGVEYALDVLGNSGVPFYYISGNHDWCYENLSDDPLAQREQWRVERLSKLYQGNNPSMYSVNIKGVKFILMDDTIGRMLPEQLDYLDSEISDDTPCVAMMHIPALKAVRHGIEGVPPYYLENHDQMSEVFENGQNEYHFLGVFCGHTHQETHDVVDGINQFVVPYNASGNYLEVYIVPAE